MTTIVKATQTSYACPSQWDAWDHSGQYWYLRFRGGHGTATAYDGPNFYTTSGWREPTFEFRDDDPLAGSIDLAAFCDRAGLDLALASGQPAQGVPRVHALRVGHRGGGRR